MTTEQREVVIERDLLSFVEVMKDKWEAGWEIDPKFPPGMVGFGSYECGLIRQASDERIEQDKVDASKPSRKEILARARAAKAAKAASAAEPAQKIVGTEEAWDSGQLGEDEEFVEVAPAEFQKEPF